MHIRPLWQVRSSQTRSTKSAEQWLLNPCWLMIIEDYTTQYIWNYNNPRTGNPHKPTSISWNDRGILKTAQLYQVNSFI